MNFRRKIACSKLSVFRGRREGAGENENEGGLGSSRPLLRASRSTPRAWDRLEGNASYYQFILIVCVSAGIVMQRQSFGGVGKNHSFPSRLSPPQPPNLSVLSGEKCQQAAVKLPSFFGLTPTL